ncbi:hypothetical protein BDV33DRAFT_50023 [Aspergillus novoparasiticus]|uniref:Uncharacterized protein n=1 Tax=Aspergillus novoparasiticus TaxID=986946 RepID=A0A5N6E8P0_9EURO|nr:hypothetical protein BDV33DRAFT_50023 [Aspergillus novoparasiticus]
MSREIRAELISICSRLKIAYPKAPFSTAEPTANFCRMNEENYCRNSTIVGTSLFFISASCFIFLPLKKPFPSPILPYNRP